MNKILNIIIISIISLTIISCSSSDESASTTTDTTQNLNAVTYGNDTFVAVGNTGTILTSSDGTTWDNRTSGTAWRLNGVTYSQ